MSQQNRGFFLVSIGLFIILFLSKVFQHGLFFDGLIYSSVSQNLANGKSTFWEPQFSETIMNSFYEHPPLVFGLEAGLMKVFGNEFYAEKLFSFLMACLVLILIGLIWRKIVVQTHYKSLFWIPVFCWIITPKNSWCFSNNLLENVLTVFTLLTVYLLLNAIRETGKKRVILILFSGFFLSLAVLSKGPTGLFPLAFLFFYFIFFHKEYGWIAALKDTAVLFISISLLFVGLFSLNETAFQAIISYLDNQVIGSITGKSRVGSRLVLMKNLFFELIPILVLAVVIIGVFWKRRIEIFSDKPHYRLSLFFVVIGLSASVPIMISPKISSFYVVPALPYFIIAISLVMAPYLFILTEKMRQLKIATPFVNVVGLISIIIGLSLTISNFKSVGRDHDLIHDLEILKTHIKPNSTISISTAYIDDWTTIAYLQRYNLISCDFLERQHLYFLSSVGQTDLENYDYINLNLRKFSLFKKQE